MFLSHMFVQILFDQANDPCFHQEVISQHLLRLQIWKTSWHENIAPNFPEAPVSRDNPVIKLSRPEGYCAARNSCWNDSPQPEKSNSDHENNWKKTVRFWTFEERRTISSRLPSSLFSSLLSSSSLVFHLLRIFSFFFLCLSLSLSSCVLVVVVVSCVYVFVVVVCACGVVCGVARWKPPCFNTSPCAPARRPQVVTLAGVVPVHTGDVSNVHTGGTHGERSGVERVEVEISVTHTNTNTNTNTHQHTLIALQQHIQRTKHNTEHAKCYRQFCLPEFAHVRLPLDPRDSPKELLDLTHFQK